MTRRLSQEEANARLAAHHDGEDARPPTPGEKAYAAFAAAMTAKHASWGMPAFADLRPAPDYQDAWEAAAAAVLDASRREAAP